MPAVVVQVAPGAFQVTVTETNASSTSETRITDVPVVGTVRRVQSEKTAGTATGVAPILGRVTNPAAAPITDTVVQPVALADAALEIDRCGSATYQAIELEDGRGVLYHRPRCNAGSDNSVVTVYHIVAGW